MRFRLHYEGPLLASQGEPRDGQVDRRSKHKDDIRHAFHRQLQYLWGKHPWLSTQSMQWEVFGLRHRHEEYRLQGKFPSLAEGLAEIHEVCGARFVPLICQEFHLLCSLKLLLLRRDRPGGILDARDLDNRLKTVFDALRMPQNLGEFDPGAAENPMFVLLQDDSLISSVSIETDDLLDPPIVAGNDDSYVRLLVEVDIRPYIMSASVYSLNFATSTLPNFFSRRIARVTGSTL